MSICSAFGLEHQLFLEKGLLLWTHPKPSDRGGNKWGRIRHCACWFMLVAD